MFFYSLHSFFFSVETKWSALTKRLANLILRPGEDDEVETAETAEEGQELTRKSSESLDKEKSLNSLKVVQNIFSDFEYGGHKWHFPIVNPDDDEVEIDGCVVKNDFYNDIKLVNKVYLSTTTKNKIQHMDEESQKILNEALFFSKHCDCRGRRHMIVFRRCDKDNRCKNCKIHARLYETPPRIITGC